MNGREGSSDDHAVPAPMRCEAITTSGARCKNHGYLGMGRKGRNVCGTHRDAVRFISEERQRDGIEQYKADRTPQELAVLAAIDRSPVAGMLQMQQIVDAMTSSERALFSTWGDLYPVIHMLQWKCGLRTRRCERGGVTELFVLRPPGVVGEAWRGGREGGVVRVSGRRGAGDGRDAGAREAVARDIVGPALHAVAAGPCGRVRAREAVAPAGRLAGAAAGARQADG